MGKTVAIRHGDSGGVTGLATCGSVWSCPVCSAKIAHGRMLEAESAIRQWVDQDGGSLGLLTLTIRHDKGDRLADLWDAVSRIWRTFVGHRAYRAARKRAGVTGYLRTTEVVYSDGGWHVHLHVLYFLRGHLERDSAEDFGGRAIDTWKASAKHHGYVAHSLGQDWKILSGTAEALVGVAGYINKGTYEVHDRVTNARSLALETSRGDLKDYSFSTSRSPFMILGDAIAYLDTEGTTNGESFRLWSEWEKASKNRRQQLWSRGFRAMLQLEAEATDEELAAAVTVEGETLVTVSARDWHTISRVGVWHVRILELAAEGDWQTALANLTAYLDSIGIPWQLPPWMDDGPAVPRSYWKVRRAA
jgi:hypothetical protein